MTIDEILSRLHGVKQTGDRQFEARCPVHDDRTASLSVGACVDGRVLVHCHAGCATESVMTAIGSTMADLQSKPVSAPRIVATYPYRDEAGKLLYQVVRYEPKAFRQRAPKNGGGFDWSVKNVRKVPYRLPELLAAPADETVYICEGEKDVDNLAKLGLVATCNSGGAGQWRNEFAGHLHDRRVVMPIKSRLH
jgi:putative DNA primase/helicase